ncbi:MAG: NAD(P)H-hydrate epimerase [Nanoarchaeota archaeon]|nr:NAD(P)H-hydrate epimerase [Nanoarchaeota archaeon]
MISAEDIKSVEENSGISKLTLMENAGRGVYGVIKEKFPELKGKRILVVCHHGNNGGDGFVVARYLADESETDILFVGDEGKFKEEAKTNFKRIEKNERIQLLVDYEAIDFNDYDVIIDAILGIGILGELKEPIKSVIGLVNSSTAFKIAVDVPTGLNPDTGEVAEEMVNADIIATFHDVKKGLSKLKDKVVVVDIGIPKEEAK